MKKTIKERNLIARDLWTSKYSKKIVPVKKGNGSYQRKTKFSKNEDLVFS